jgi:DNA invertase Pin-like site-specific DNA recombinase
VGSVLKRRKRPSRPSLLARASTQSSLRLSTEVESGKRSDNRPELTKAMQHVHLTGATLLIAKLDRLSRDAHFLLGLQKDGVQFVAADMPEANEMVVGIMAVIAQADRKMISTRTKAALAEARRRVAVSGRPDVKRLGCPTGAAHLHGRGFGALGVRAIKEAADRRAAGLASTFDSLRADGVTSSTALAKALNDRGYATPRGGKWTAGAVIDIAARLQVIRVV